MDESERVSFWTFTSRYNPNDPSDLTAEALRERAVALSDAVRKVYTKVFVRRECVGMTYSVELGHSGLVHIHALVIGPYVPKAVVEAAGRKLYANFGHTFVKQVATKLDQEGRRAAREVAKYSVKSPGPRSERWLAGMKLECIDPRLAARWEVATLNLNLHRNYGIFRAPRAEEELSTSEVSERESTGEFESLTVAAEARAPCKEASLPDPSARSPAEAVETLDCASCGLVGKWKPVTVFTDKGVRELHARRLPALWRSGWRASADDF